jgi:hypothetical protein
MSLDVSAQPVAAQAEVECVSGFLLGDILGTLNLLN